MYRKINASIDGKKLIDNKTEKEINLNDIIINKYIEGEPIDLIIEDKKDVIKIYTRKESSVSFLKFTMYVSKFVGINLKLKDEIKKQLKEIIDKSNNFDDIYDSLIGIPNSNVKKYIELLILYYHNLGGTNLKYLNFYSRNRDDRIKSMCKNISEDILILSFLNEKMPKKSKKEISMFFDLLKKDIGNLIHKKPVENDTDLIKEFGEYLWEKKKEETSFLLA